MRAFPWGAAVAMVSPSFALAVGAGALGITTGAGLALAIAAAAWVAVDLLMLQPRLFATAGPDTVAHQFLERGLAARTVEEVAEALGRAVETALGRGGASPRALLIVPDAAGEIRVIHVAGVPDGRVDLGDTTLAFDFLGHMHAALGRADLEAIAISPEISSPEGPRAAIALLDRTGCDVILPLRHRGMLLGVALIGPPLRLAPNAPEVDRFHRALRAYTTAAIAHTLLGAESRTRTQLTRSFDLATAMQEAMMPEERPVRRPTFELRGLFRPVAECGGDLWAWRDLGDDRVLLLVADATGHGAAPALLAAVAKGTLDAVWEVATADGRAAEIDPGALLSELNRAVHRAGRKRYFMTAFVAIVDIRAGVAHYANAGQNFPYLIGAPRPDVVAPTIEALLARGDPLGAAPEARYQTRSRPIAPGDRILLYTDGATDAGAPYREPWGEKRLRAALANLAGERATRLPELLMAEIERHTGGAPLTDDVTLLAFQVGSYEEAA